MIGLERVWNVVTGGRAKDLPSPPRSTIPRAVPTPRNAEREAASDSWEPPSKDTRSAERFVPHRTGTVLTTATGKRIAARIINMSGTGVAVEAEMSGFGPKDIVMIGTRPVVPGRRITLGMVFRFKKPLDPRLCDRDIVL